MIDIYYPNHDKPERPRESVVDDMNRILMENTKDGDKVLTVQGIADMLGVDGPTYHDWVRNDPDFIEGIKGYLKLVETGVPEAFKNRLDAGAIAVHIMETKHRKSGE